MPIQHSVQPREALAVGSPSFDDPLCAQEARLHGAAAAWRLALSQGPPHSAAAGVGGDFAVALPLPGGGGFLAVDRFAVRSLCYRIDDGVMRWAERADALAEAGTAPVPQAIFEYLYFHCIPSPHTVFEGVHRLPPGHCAVYSDGQLVVAPYWVPSFAPSPSANFDALRAEFRQLLQRAVQRQLDGSRPACYLSGGTDSSTIAGMVGVVVGRPAATYSIGFDAEGYDEMQFARVAARHFGTDHHEYYVTPDDLVRHIPLVAASYDQPFGNSSALPAYCCALAARADGVTRLLAGDGGDELFGGNTRYAKQRVFGWYTRLPAALRQQVLEPVLSTRLVAGLPLLRKGASYVEQARVAMPDRLQMYNLLLRLGIGTVLEPEFLAHTDTQAPARQQREVWAAAQAHSLVDRMLAYDWRYTLAESDLPKVRGSSGLAGVEVGFPLLDRDLLEFSLRLPTAYKLKGLTLRWFFKEALRGFLPDQTLRKKKQGFGLPFGVWMMQHPDLKSLAVDSLRSLSTRGIVRPAFIDSLLLTHLQQHPGYYGEMVWILMMLEQWLRHHAPDFRLATRST